jgi:large subunit ribosomal protein L10
MPSVRNHNSVKNLSEKFKAMKGLILTEYHGLKVEEISMLRLKLKALNCEYVIVKNILMRIALKEAGIESNYNFSGPTALVIENEDIVLPAKAVVDFAKGNSKLKIKAGFLEGKFVEATIIGKLSSLPSKEVLITKMLGSMNAPITKFVNVLAANIRGLVTVLNAIVKKEQAA